MGPSLVVTFMAAFADWCARLQLTSTSTTKTSTSGVTPKKEDVSLVSAAAAEPTQNLFRK